MKNIFLIACAWCVAGILHAQPSEKFRVTHYNLSKGNVAVLGYDPVSYFTENTAAMGNSNYRLAYAGVIYQFTSREHLELFRKDPAHYEPQYGGWCAYAMGQSGEKVEIDPETFKIVDGKLYLFYNKYFNNTLTDWNKNQSVLMSKADKNWLHYLSH